jgi:flagellar motor switch protein FliN/FliY
MTEAAIDPQMSPLTTTHVRPGGRSELGLLASVDTELSVVVGRSRLPIRDLLALDPGSVIELDRRPGDPVEVLVNGTLVARGEVVIVEGEFGVRIVELVRANAEPQG